MNQAPKGVPSVMETPIQLPGYPIDGNRWSENQSINRYQSIKLVNWYRLVSVNRWSIDNHTKTVHRLLSIGTATSNRPHAHARYPSDQRPLLGDRYESWQNKTTQSPLHVYSNYHLPVIVFPCHYVDAKSPGRGSTEYKVYRQRLSSLPFWGKRRWGLYC